MTCRGPFQPLLFCDSVILTKGFPKLFCIHHSHYKLSVAFQSYLSYMLMVF